MTRIITIALMTLVVSCSQVPSENFYHQCNESTLSLTHGIEITDSLGYFSYLVPDSSWKPLRHLGDNENGVTVGDTSEGYLRAFNVNQSNYTYEWNWDEEQKNIEEQFNVIESGEILLNGEKRKYNIVHFTNDTPQIVTFYVTVLDQTDKRQYTLATSTEYSENYYERICQMKPLIESFSFTNSQQTQHKHR